MSGDQVFVVSGSTATRAEETVMAGSQLLEHNLQSWVKQHPDLLGEELLIVTEEFDRWGTASGGTVADRLDVLALDRSGTLVVAELKRHEAPKTVLVQALNYAALASRFTVDDLVEAHARFLQKRSGTSDAEPDDQPAEGVDLRDHARARLLRFAEDLSESTISAPRIVLMAEDFGAVLTNTSLYLIESGMDLRLMRVGLFKLPDGTTAMTTSQVLPIPRAERIMVRPGATQPGVGRREGDRSRRSARLGRLIASGVIPDGEKIAVVAPRHNTKVDIDAIRQWLTTDPVRGRASWRNDAAGPVVWEVDGRPRSLLGLIREIVLRATGEEDADVWGFAWLQVPDGRTLAKIADSLPDLLRSAPDAD